MRSQCLTDRHSEPAQSRLYCIVANFRNLNYFLGGHFFYLPQQDRRPRLLYSNAELTEMRRFVTSAL